MKKYIFGIISSVVFISCSNENIPDVSHIKVELQTQRFEKDFFALDTNNLKENLDKLIAAYPGFGENFMESILGANLQWTGDTLNNYVKEFIGGYKKVNDTAQIVFRDFKPYEDRVKKALQFVKYYFPKYKIPTKLITFTGPLDGYGDILSDDAFIVGLQHHLGSNYSMYNTKLVQEEYPSFITKRFEPGYIDVNCVRNIMDDMFPEKIEHMPLVQQMVEKGKRLYVMQKLLPKTAQHRLIGYSYDEYEMCMGIERTIWDFFLQNDLLQNTNANMIKNYIGESPKTQELVSDKGIHAPGNIGSFAGWQIVKKYMSKNSDLSLEKLMTTDAETIFSEAKYKP